MNEFTTLAMALVVLLIVLIALQHIFYTNQIQKLVDKLMSRSYTEYVKATEPVKPKIIIPENPEDFDSLKDFT